MSLNFGASYKAKQAALSVLGSKVMAFRDAHNVPFNIKYDLQ